MRKGIKELFKEMAKFMPDEEVKRCMAILVEDSMIQNIERDQIQNTIKVTFQIVGDARQLEYSLTLLPDSIQDISEGVSLRIDGEYLYIQYLIAKGYSEYWKGNMFI